MTHVHIEPLPHGFLLLKFPYDEGLVKWIKQFPGAEWGPHIGQPKGWVIPEELRGAITALEVTAAPEYPLQVEAEVLPGEPSYQAHGIKVLYNLLERYRGALLCDEMGLGKTREAIMAVKELGLGKVLVLCPAIAKGVWEDEIEKWDQNATWETLSGVTPPDSTGFALADTEGKCERIYTICNYDIVAPRTVSRRVKPEGDDDRKFDSREYMGWAGELVKVKYDLVILDEFRHVKSGFAKKRAAVKRICDSARYRLGLDGTPVADVPRDLWSPLDLILPGRFGRYFASTRLKIGFGFRYCGAVYNGYGYDFDGLSNDKELKARLSWYMIRRLVKDVMPELPPLKPIPVPITPAKTTDAMTPDMSGVGGGNLAQFTVALTAALSALSKAKVPHALELIEERMDSHSHIIVWCHFRDTQRSIMNTLLKKKHPWGVWGFHGGDSHQERKKQIDGWRVTGGPLVVTTDTAGQALTLVEATWEIQVDMEWSATKLAQAWRRAIRKGQTKFVGIEVLLAKGTVDDLLRQTVLEKKEMEETLVKSGAGELDELAAGVMKDEHEILQALMGRLLKQPAIKAADRWMTEAAQSLDDNEERE